MAGREEDVLALRDAKVQAQVLSQLMVRSFLAAANIDEAEQGLS